MKKIKPQHKPKYPWKKWFGKKGTKTRIRYGKHFKCQINTMWVNTYSQAKRHGIKVKLTMADGVAIIIENVGRQPRKKK